MSPCAGPSPSPRGPARGPARAPLAVVQRDGETREQAGPQGGVGLVESGESIGDAVDDVVVDGPVATHLPQPDLSVGERGLGEQGAVVASLGDRERTVVHGRARRQIAGPALRVGELEQCPSLLGRGDARHPIEGVERGLPLDHGLVVGEPLGGLLGGEARRTSPPAR